MLENASENVKRFVPPPSRNRSINRRRSGDRFDKVNYSHGADDEKSQASYTRNFSAVEHGEIGNNNVANENVHPKLIQLQGCSSSLAVQFLTDRWAAAVHLLEDPSSDVSARPVIYSGASGSSWVHSKLPQPVDFLVELQCRMNKANSNAGSTASDDC
ncbi:hypothetical protein Cni_G09613 [Canna indica]|uniref:Uncharacterized protein n=1 Tax=Canna indica TaxID=4628 RepID=A0AAQ3Q9T6_9LILI|nr:hypothetical protein Cni_G09613 [Canna indica]